jgi:hypothetical protein
MASSGMPHPPTHPPTPDRVRSSIIIRWEISWQQSATGSSWQFIIILSSAINTKQCVVEQIVLTVEVSSESFHTGIVSYNRPRPSPTYQFIFSLSLPPTQNSTSLNKLPSLWCRVSLPLMFSDQNFVFIFRLSHACLLHGRPSYPSGLDHPDSIW